MTLAITPGRDAPVLLVKWYDFTRWLLERIDSFPKNQRFVFGTRLADHALDVLESLVEASYSRRKLIPLSECRHCERRMTTWEREIGAG